MPGSFLGWLAGSVFRVRRATVEAAMRRAGVAAPAREARAMYGGLGRGVFELLWLAGACASRRDRVLGEHVVLDDDLKAALSRGPVVIAASHTANWELVAYGAARHLAAEERRLAIVVKPLSVGVFDALCTRLRRACGLTLIAPTGAVHAVRQALAAGDVVAMPIDQVPDRARHGIRVPFLGAPALVDRAPATLARIAETPMLVVAASRDGDVVRVHLLDELSLSSPSPVASATRASTDALSAFVLARPAEWLWLHRRWRAPRTRRPAAAHPRDPAALVATRQPG